MTYEEATGWLFQQLPMFQRTGPAAYKSNLDGTLYVLEKMGRPDLHLDGVIHVAGTNGKGSVCTAISNALVETGFRVGLFTSPHLMDFRERLLVCGEMPQKAWVVDRVKHFQNELPNWSYQPSFFEWTFGLALLWFVEEQVDAVVLETGMGGRLDSTNVFPTPLVTAITNIGLDHQQFLGQDIRSIALEKAGILKDGVPVVLGRMRPEAQSVILSAALRTGSEVFYADAARKRGIEEDPNWPENEATTLKVLEVLSNQPGWREWQAPAKVHPKGLGGRWEWLTPTVNGTRILVDSAHNYDGVKRLVGAINAIERKRLMLVFGTVGDKELNNIWTLLPSEAEYFFCGAKIPRAFRAEELCEEAHRFGLKGMAFPSVSAALNEASAKANSNDLIVVFGSLFVTAEVLNFD